MTKVVAQAFGHLAIRQTAGVRFTQSSRILPELTDGPADRTRDKRLRALIRPTTCSLSQRP